MNSQATTLKTLELPSGTLLPFPAVPGETVRILYGRVWLTEEGNARDSFLASGEEVALHSRGLAVIEALGPARIQWIKPVHERMTLTELAGRAITRARLWLRRRQRSAECRVS